MSLTRNLLLEIEKDMENVDNIRDMVAFLNRSMAKMAASSSNFEQKYSELLKTSYEDRAALDRLKPSLESLLSDMNAQHGEDIGTGTVVRDLCQIIDSLPDRDVGRSGGSRG